MFPEAMNYIIWGNKISAYCLALISFIVCCLVLYFVKRIILRRIKKWAETTSSTIDDFLVKIMFGFFIPLGYLAAFYLIATSLLLAPFAKKIVSIFGMALLTILTARLFSLLIEYGFQVYIAKVGKNEALERSLKGILRVAKFIIWGLAIVFFLDNTGFEISTVIAGLGIGGIAVAMAAQAVLKDLFSYFSILFDRPFEIGDFIVVGDYSGSVEYIGIKTTRIRTLNGEQLIIANKDLTDARLKNYKTMEKRRVAFTIGVTYQTSLNQLKEIPDIVESIITQIPDTEYSRTHFSKYGDYSLIFDVVYYINTADYVKYMDTQQEINLQLREKFENKGIEFALPAQTLFMNK